MADAAEAAPAVRITSLAYDELVTGKDLREEIERAFGYDGPGLLTVSGVPGLAEARARLLPLARAFATLPDATKRKYEHARSFYSIGWSHGREKLQGRPDVAKGSYYANPLHDAPFSDPADIAKYPAFAEPNVWPTEELPELRGAFMHAGQLIHAVGCLVASQCDRFVSERLQDRYPPQRISQLLRSSRCCKARLLHYFATKGTDAQSAPRAHHELANLPPADGAAADGISADDDAFSNWCGWHNDHGTLTGLLPAMYIGADGAAEMECPDAAAGLYVRSRCGRLIHVRIPSGHLAFQIGETAQVHSGGILQATPHAVRGVSTVSGVSRSTFAVFMEPEWGCPMSVPQGVRPEDAQSGAAAALLPKAVPPLHSRWSNEQSFGDFTSATLQAYH